MNLERVEKEKRKIPLKKRIWRFSIGLILLIVLIPLLYLGGRYVYNYAMYLMHLQAWNEQGLDAKVIVDRCSLYPYSFVDPEHQELCLLFSSPQEVEEIFDEALRCINIFFCEVRYDEQYSYPSYIRFERENHHTYMREYEGFPNTQNE